jgi:histidine triad (HIT) family protein
MEDCLFCKIIGGQIPGDFVFKDERVVAFKDIHPMAPLHLLIVPREHIGSLADITESKAGLIAHMVTVANKLAKQNGVADRGYRLVINSGPEGGQVVQHLHMHLLGGKPLDGKLG